MKSDGGKLRQDNTADGMGLESDDMIKNRSDENTDWLDDKTTDVVKEQSKELSKHGRVPDDVIEQTSPVQQTDISRHFKRNFGSVIIGSDHKFTVHSRYRHASAGSCHDLCKHGHNHERERAEKRPLLGTIRDRESIIRAASGDNLARSLSKKETENKAPVRRLFHSGPISKKDVLIHIDGTNSPKRITSPEAKIKRVQSERQPSSVSTPRNSFCKSKIEVSAVKENLPVKQKVEAIEKEENRRHSDSGKVKAKELMSSNSPRTPLEKSPSIKATLYRNLKSFSRSRRQSDSAHAIITKSRVVPEIAVELNAKCTEKGIKSSLPNEESACAQRESRLGKTKNSRIIEEGEHKRNTSRAKSIVNQSTKDIRAGIVRLKEKDDSAWKVNFRKGTVVDLQPENDPSRKLQFKKGRILEEDQNAKAEISLKNTDEMTDALPDIKPEPEKVHFRWQESSGKKHGIDLNNVIRETASKLVKTSNSKVKALIDAFETLMSFRHVNHSLKQVHPNTE
ncbi:hypothetical protein vseg_017173 [Gypsophila vaccaria]